MCAQGPARPHPSLGPPPAQRSAAQAAAAPLTTKTASGMPRWPRRPAGPSLPPASALAAAAILGTDAACVRACVGPRSTSPRRVGTAPSVAPIGRASWVGGGACEEPGVSLATGLWRAPEERQPRAPPHSSLGSKTTPTPASGKRRGQLSFYYRSELEELRLESAERKKWGGIASCTPALSEGSAQALRGGWSLKTPALTSAYQ